MKTTFKIINTIKNIQKNLKAKINYILYKKNIQYLYIQIKVKMKNYAKNFWKSMVKIQNISKKIKKIKTMKQIFNLDKGVLMIFSD